MLRGILLLLLTSALAPIPAQDGPTLVEDALTAWKRETKKGDLASELSKLGPGVAPYLAQLLAEKRHELPRGHIARALGRLGGQTALTALESLSDSASLKDREAAMLGFGEMTDPSTIPLLVRALEDEGRVVVASSDALVQRARRGSEKAILNQVAKRLRVTRDLSPYVTMLGSVGTPGAHKLIRRAMTAASDQREQVACLEALTKIRSPNDVDVGTELLQAQTHQVRKAACALLGALGRRSAVPDLIELMELDENRGVVVAAHRALRRITKVKLGKHPSLWRVWWQRSQTSERSDGRP